MTRDYVESKVMKMGMPNNLKGYTYIVDAVMLLDDPNWADAKLTAIYYKISEKRNCTEASVERNIRTAFEASRNNLENYDIVNHYIGYSNCQNGHSLKMLHDVIKKDIVNEHITEEDKLIITKDYLRHLIDRVLTDIIDDELCLGSI